MLSYIIKRLIQGIPILVISAILVFLLIHLIPGDPATNMLGPDATDEQVEALKEKLGLNEPLIKQFFIWFGGILRGDMGTSFRTRRSVSQMIGERVPATFQLALFGILFAVLFSFPLGTVAALKERKPADWIISGITSLSIATPNFWIGILLILFFAVNLRWLPPGGRVPFSMNAAAALKTLILPVLVLTIRQTAVLTRFVKVTVSEVLTENYIRTAHSKGLPHVLVMLRHVIPNTLIPVTTIIGIQFGRLLGGAVVIESVFAWPGVGLLLLEAIKQRDYALVQGTFLFIAAAFILINIATDILYGVLDPRVRVTGKA